jgi:hypothetical protein
MHNCNARWPKRDLRICHAKPAALAIRLLRDASFQQKNASTRQQKSNEKRSQAGAFDGPYGPRPRNFNEELSASLFVPFVMSVVLIV